MKRTFARAMGITEVYGGMSPEEKVEVVRRVNHEAPTLYLGDGMNDAPAMMQAAAGVALGGNRDITAEAAGAVILQSSLQSVDELIHIGGRMRRIALQSAIGGMSLSLVGMLAAAFGYLAPIQGALMQEGIDLLSIFNSLRMVLGPLSDFTSAENARAAPEGTLALLIDHPGSCFEGIRVASLSMSCCVRPDGNSAQRADVDRHIFVHPQH